MAPSASAITPPPGFELEQPQQKSAITPPPGFELESAQQKAPAKAAEPGFLDKDIPLSGPWYNPTLSGVQSIGRGVRSAVRGIGETFDPRVHEGEESIAAPGDPRGLIARPAYRIGKGLIDTAKQVPEIPGAIHDINNQTAGDPAISYGQIGEETAGEGAGQALTALATEGIGRGLGSIPKEVTTAPVRLGARGAEGMINSSPLRYVRSAGKLFTPADEARKMIRVPGRDFGLDTFKDPGAPLPERPLPAIVQSRGLQIGGRSIPEPSEALARIPPTGAGSDTSLALSPKGKIGGRFVLTPEEIQQAEQVQKIAARRASERGMQYAAGMKPSGAKIAAP